jgi:excisionase family DNA binding protein
VATSGEKRWPRLGRNRWPLTGEVASLLRVTPRTVRRWSQAGQLEPVRLGRLVRYTQPSVDALISNSDDALITQSSPRAATPGSMKISGAGGGRDED